MQEVVLPAQVEDAFQLQRDVGLAARGQLFGQADGLIGVGDAVFRDAQQADHVLTGGFGDHGDVVGAPRDRVAQGAIGRLVVQRRVRQAQRDQVVDGVDVGNLARVQRQGGGPVHDVGRGGGGCGLERDRRLLAIGGEAAIGVGV
ncbi:hypothetical protein D3C72_1795380 [compost metagenome]